MPTTANGEVSLYYETFGADDDPVLLLVNGLGSQCINFKTEFCEMFADRGFRVVRFDNRDVGLSSHLKGGPRYTVDDMARDGFAVLDAIGADVAHIAGWSMGGMIVQAMALLHPGRVLSMTSVMSAPGAIAGERDPDVTAAFSAPAGRTRDEAAGRRLAGLKAWGSPACFDVERITADSTLPTTGAGTEGQAASVPRSSPPGTGEARWQGCASPRWSYTATATRLSAPRAAGPPPPPSPAPGSSAIPAWATICPGHCGHPSWTRSASGWPRMTPARRAETPWLSTQ
jgi:pimeloyl-ACP methyl ester carboxylesterase